MVLRNPRRCWWILKANTQNCEPPNINPCVGTFLFFLGNKSKLRCWVFYVTESIRDSLTQPCEFSEQPSLSVALDTKVNFSAMHRYVTRHLGVLLVTKGTLTYRNMYIISSCLCYFLSITHFVSSVGWVAALSSGFGDIRCSYSCLNDTHVVTVTALEEENREVKGSPLSSGMWRDPPFLRAPPRKGAAIKGHWPYRFLQLQLEKLQPYLCDVHRHRIDYLPHPYGAMNRFPRCG